MQTPWSCERGNSMGYISDEFISSANLQLTQSSFQLCVASGLLCQVYLSKHCRDLVLEEAHQAFHLKAASQFAFSQVPSNQSTLENNPLASCLSACQNLPLPLGQDTILPAPRVCSFNELILILPAHFRLPNFWCSVRFIVG